MNKPNSAASTVDPFSAEIARMALESMAEEMATTMKLTSGSPVLTEGQDFSTALLTPDGEHICYAGYVTVHIASSLLGTRLVMEKYGREDIKPGDHFLSNDPFKGGACHSADNYVVKPIFVDGEIVCWAYSGAHILDVGGADPGGWSPASFDMFGEAIHIPPLKIVKEGRLNLDLCAMIENNVRLPRLYINDVKSFVAANNTADQRIALMVREHGIERFRELCAFNQELSERMMRERIAKIPDGVYETVDWVEHDGHRDMLFAVRLRMTVDGSDLHFDFSGSDPQGRGGMNAALAGLLGGVWTALVQILAYDIPFNAGVMRPVRVNPGEPGTLTNPKRPAPTGAGHIDTGAKASKMVTELLSRAFSKSDDAALRARVSGQFQDCFSANVWDVIDQYGRPCLIGNMDSGGAGGPAQTCCDGLDAAAMMCQVNNQLPDVESNESLYPMLYLWKRLQTDSGGPGKFRGGLGLDFAWTLWGTEVAHGMLNACTRSVPPRGMFGGLPPGTSRFLRVGRANVDALLEDGLYPSSETLEGNAELLPAKGFPIELHAHDVFIQWCGGGSGVGDPLLRAPERVARDVADGYVTMHQAERAYGVIIDTATGDATLAKTAERRLAMRRARLGGHGPLATIRDLPLPAAHMLSLHVGLLNADGPLQVGCVLCGTAICQQEEDWTTTVPCHIADLTDGLGALGIWVQSRDDGRLCFAERYCPGCGTLLDTSIVRPAAVSSSVAMA